MKLQRINRLLLAAAAVLSLSCAKEAAETLEPESKPSAYEGVSVDFTTTFTKTTLGEVEGGNAQILWEAGDKISVMGYYTDTDGTEKQFCYVAAASEAGASTVFTAVVPDNATDIYAVYPSTACSALTKDSGGKVSVPVTVKQAGLTTAFKDAHFCVAKTTLAEKTLNFKNVASILAFEIGDTKSFTSLNRPQYMSLDFKNLWGTLPVSFNDDGAVAFGTPTETSQCADMGDAFKQKMAAGKHYLALLPADYPEGFALNLNFFDDPACIYPKKADLSKPTILDIGKVDGKWQRDFYVTVSGAGEKTGKDWANAMGRDEFVAALARKTPEANVEIARFLQIWTYKGSTFHLGAGTYVLGDADSNGLEVNFQKANGTSYCTIDILGGYPAGGGDARDIKANITKFSGDGKYHILSVKDRARLNIDGVTFCDAYFAGECNKTAAKMGAALFLTDSFADKNDADWREAHAKGAARVSLKDCIFENNRNESSNVDKDAYYGGGSAIAFQKGYLYADGCKFLNNYDEGCVGCVATCGNYDYQNLKSELFFNACLFEGNTTGTGRDGTGHVVNHKTKGILLGMYNCTFHANDKAAEDGKYYNTNVIDIRRSSIIANTTIYQVTFGLNQGGTGWTGYPVRIDGGVVGMNRHIFVNNVFQSTPDASGNGDYRSFALCNTYGWNKDNTTDYNGGVYFKGNNVLSTILNCKLTSQRFYMTKDDETFFDAAKNLKMTWDETLGVFTWDSGETKSTNMTLEKMKAALQSTDIDSGDNSAYYWGTDFYKWLVSIAALDKDALGNTRPAEGWLAGSYQQEN